jgi:hypothetical protein
MYTQKLKTKHTTPDPQTTGSYNTKSTRNITQKKQRRTAQTHRNTEHNWNADRKQIHDTEKEKAPSTTTGTTENALRRREKVVT